MSLDAASQVPTELLLLLNRQALGDYSMACEAAQAAAEQSGAHRPSPDAGSRLRGCRANVMAAEEVLDLVGDETATRASCNGSLDGRRRLLIAGLVGTALERLCEDLESSEEEICAAAARIQGLHTLLDQLRPVG